MSQQVRSSIVSHYPDFTPRKSSASYPELDDGSADLDLEAFSKLTSDAGIELDPTSGENTQAGPKKKRKPGTRPDVSGTVADQIKRTPKIKVDEEEEEEEDWQHRLRYWIAGFAAAGYGISLIVHTVLLIVLAMILLPGIVGDGDGMTTASIGQEKDSLELFDGIDSAFDEEPAEEATQEPEEEQLVVEPPPVELGQLSATLPRESIPVPAIGDGSGKSKTSLGGGGPVAVGVGGNAVTAGSFTVWTIPEDPLPFQNYQIVIQIKMKDNRKTYPINDVSGRVIGTDTYTQEIPGGRRGVLPVVNKHVRFSVYVPGAANLVEDTILIRSQLLNESQSIKIVF